MWKVGQRVIVISWATHLLLGTLRVGMEGIVVTISEDSSGFGAFELRIGVDFENWFEGHDLEGVLSSTSGYYFFDIQSSYRPSVDLLVPVETNLLNTMEI